MKNATFDNGKARRDWWSLFHFLTDGRKCRRCSCGETFFQDRFSGEWFCMEAPFNMRLAPSKYCCEEALR